MATTQEQLETNVAWFDQQPTDSQIPAQTRQLLETYSGVPAEEVIEHVVTVRNEAWKIFPYPCIGQFRFLEPGIDELDEYREAVERLQGGQKLLDMACCFGQTIRRLVADEAPGENIYGCDLQPDFIQLGYKLFKDRGKLKSNFLTADIFDPRSSLVDLKGQVDIVYAGSFFHLWGMEQQREVSKAVFSLLRPQQGSLILGRQVGAVEAAEKISATGAMYRHNVESFKKMWKELGEELDVQLTVQAKLQTLKSDHFMVESDDTRRILFSVRRE
jgi:SAM-dependent methyltransferase